jgi:nitroimidazol reductase NimA-like FMN-containing flavoprotein (pyridoxamine 5'-phosphate oxidase superfamily)
LRNLAQPLSESPQARPYFTQIPPKSDGINVAIFVFAMTRTLSDNEAWDVLRQGKLGHLACVDRDQPYVVPINYLVDEGFIYSHSLPGRKISAMRAHQRACLQVNRIQDDFHWRSAIAFGSYEEISDPADRNSVLRQLLERFPKLTPVESELARDAEPPPVIAFRLRVDRVSGVAEE